MTTVRLTGLTNLVSFTRRMQIREKAWQQPSRHYTPQFDPPPGMQTVTTCMANASELVRRTSTLPSEEYRR
jgi:hypothetical protein